VEEKLEERPEDWEKCSKQQKDDYNMIRFFKVAGSDLDHEIREITDGQDELMHMLDMTSQFTITILFLVVTSFYIATCFKITYPSVFDEKVILNLIAQKEELNFNRYSCKVRMEESRYAPSLWALVSGQALLTILIFCSQSKIEHF
jgi:hypothetical protein